LATQLSPLACVNDRTPRIPFNVPRHILLVVLCACFALLTLAFPVSRAFFRVEVSYNEGWNIYNAKTLVDHQLLYPVAYGWRSVNYPMLSFAIVAQLHQVTHDYLFTARMMSLIGLAGSSFLVGAIVRRLGASRQAAVLAGFFCVGMFATDADVYVGSDDPQMFAQIFFLAGLLLYLWRRSSGFAIAGAALLFVVGGSIKHNPIDFPLAVLIDLALVAPRRAMWFSLCGLSLAATSVALNIHFGGPYCIVQLTSPRSWQLSKAGGDMVTMMGPLLLPFVAAICMAYVARKDAKRRIATILLATSMLVGGYFGGGRGVSYNAFFSALLAIAILCGLAWDRLWKMMESETAGVIGDYSRRPGLGFAPAIFFAWLAIPWLLVPAINSGFDRNKWDPMRRMQETKLAERRFDHETAVLRNLYGPALCESLLRCYYAGKPYEVDPFNATRLIRFGKIDAKPIIEDLRLHRYAAVQLDSPIQQERHSDRFDPAVEAAIEQNYVPVLTNADGEIYVPRTVPLACCGRTATADSSAALRNDKQNGGRTSPRAEAGPPPLPKDDKPFSRGGD